MRGRKGRIFGIVPMTGELAAKITAWEYPGEYAVYNWDEGSPWTSCWTAAPMPF